jgi:hypothetical protein
MFLREDVFMRADSIRYLNDAGFDFKPAESPDLWTHLESHFSGARRIGSKFNPLPASAVAELIAKGEEALLDALVLEHQRTGTLASVTQVVDMPYIVGIDGDISLSHAKAAETFDLIEQPGTIAERLIHVLPAGKDSIPPTCQATVRGGLYPDGRTVGFYALSPGNHADEDRIAAADHVYLATPEDIAALAKDMETNAEEIVLVTRQECDAMIARVKRLLKG